MSSVTDLINAHNYMYGRPSGGRSAASAANDFLSEMVKQKKEEERVKTTEKKLQKLLEGDGDYQNHYKIKPSYDSKSGEIGFGLAEKSDADRFSQAVQGGLSPNDLRMQFPQYADKVDNLEISGVFNQGARIPAAPQMGAPIPAGPMGARIPVAGANQNMTMSDSGQPGYEYIPELDALGRPKGFKTVKSPALEAKEKMDMERAKSMAEIEAGQRAAENSFTLIAGSLNDLAQTYANAFREGGVGSKLKETASGARLWLGGKQAESLDDTAALPGQLVEVISKMMPMLTAQGDNPGSVRLVESIFRKLEKSFPGMNTPPKNARRMMETTTRNMFRFARAASIMADQMGVTDQEFSSASPQQQKTWSQQLERIAETVQLSPEEQAQIDMLIEASLQPIDDLISGKDSTTRRVSGSSPHSYLWAD